MSNTKDSFRTQLEEAAGRAGFTHSWSGRTHISNFKGDGWRLALTWDADEAPASLTAYHRDNAGKREVQVAEAILADGRGGYAWLFDVVKRFLGYNTYQSRLELIQDMAVPAVEDTGDRSEDVLADVEAARKFHADRGQPYDPDTVQDGHLVQGGHLTNPARTREDTAMALPLQPNSFVRMTMTAEQADKIPAGMPLADALRAVHAENDSWDALRADVNATSEALGVPLVVDSADEATKARMAYLDQQLTDTVQKLVQVSSHGLPQRVRGEAWPEPEPEDSPEEKAEQRARHLAADMFTSYWDGRDADMFDADDVTHLLTLLDIARKAGR